MKTNYLKILHKCMRLIFYLSGILLFFNAVSIAGLPCKDVDTRKKNTGSILIAKNTENQKSEKGQGREEKSNSGKYSVQYGKYSGTEGHYWMTALVPCDKGICTTKKLNLGSGSNMRPGGLIDLEGSPFTHNSYRQIPPAPLSGSAKYPAAIFYLDSNQKKTTGQEMIIVSLKGSMPQIIFRWNLKMVHEKHGGYDSTGDICFSREPGRKMLTIGLRGTSIPDPNDPVMRPGPPVHITFQFQDGQYLVTNKQLKWGAGKN